MSTTPEALVTLLGVRFLSAGLAPVKAAPGDGEEVEAGPGCSMLLHRLLLLISFSRVLLSRFTGVGCG